MDKLSDKELQVLDRVGRNSSISQRELARDTGISLGLINVILKKFLQVGYLQVSRLNKRKLEYVLTPAGFLAMARRTYNYATRTIRNYQSLHSQIAALLSELCKSGYDYFSIHGDGELREMIEVIAPGILSEGLASLGSEHRDGPNAVVLNITAEPIVPEFNGSVVSVLERIEQ